MNLLKFFNQVQKNTSSFMNGEGQINKKPTRLWGGF